MKTVRKKNSYKYKESFRRFIGAAAGLITAACICLPAMAADSDVVFAPDPDDAEKAHVYVGAIVEEGCKEDITVELYPSFSAGTVHRYVLTEKEGYLTFDDIMVGEYDAVAYMTGAESSMSATYIGGTQEVAVGKGAPYFAAVGGSSSFVSEYGWLSSYAIEKGTMLSGEITEEEAKGFFKETIAKQGMPEESLAERSNLDAAEAEKQAREEAQAAEGTQGSDISGGTENMDGQDQATQVPVNTDDKNTQPKKKTAPVSIFAGVGIIAAVLIAGTIYIRRRKQK